MEKDNALFQEWLVKLNQLLLKANPDARELILELKNVVLNQRAMMEKFFQTIQESFPSGFDQALVLRAKKVAVTGYQEQQYGDFRLHDKVSLHPNSPFAKMPNLSDVVGEIVEFDPEGYTGWALVQMSNGKKKPLRYGNPQVDGGVCDLMLMEKALIGQTETSVASVLYHGGIVDIFNYLEIPLEPGDTVLIHPRLGTIIGKTESLEVGKICFVEEVIDSQALVSVDGTKKMVIIPERLSVKAGDRVLTDDNINVVLQILPKTKSVAIVSDIDPVKWDDVIGLTEAKAEAMEVINFVLYPEMYRQYKAKEPKGILLIGPPGNGKTHFGRALATLLSERLESADGSIKGFMYIKATEILDMYVGEAPRKVREIFAKAEEYHKQTGQKVIIFIDEVESVLQKRGSKSNNDSADAITNAFLTEMDGIQKSYGFVIGATNRPDLIDDAALRAGRLDRVIKVGRPKNEDVPKFFDLYLKNTVINKEFTLEEIIQASSEEYLSPDHAFYELYYAKDGVNPQDESIPKKERFNLQYFKLSDVGSGAMIETIVNRAKFKAIDRDLKSKSKEPSGILLTDIQEAVAEAYESNKLIDHEAAIAEYIQQQKTTPLEVIEVTNKV